jgi:hypothetical protein
VVQKLQRDRELHGFEGQTEDAKESGSQNEDEVEERTRT